MPRAVQSVIVVADAVLVRAGAVVDVVKEVGVAQQSERAENGGLVDGRQCVLDIGQAESTGECMPDLPPNEKPDRGNADSGLLKQLLISELIVYIHFLNLQCAHGVEYCQHCHAYVGEDGHPHGCNT